MGNIYSLCRGCVLAAFFLIAFSVHAETIPATASGTAGWEAAGNTPVFPVTTYSEAAQKACTMVVGSGGQILSYSPESAPGLTYPQSVALSVQCLYKDLSTNINHYAYASIRSTWDFYTCPDASWTLEGMNCTRQDCPANTVWNPVSQTCRCENGSDVGDNGQCCPQPGEAIAKMQECTVFSDTATSCNSSDSNGCRIRCTDVTFQKPPSCAPGAECVQINNGILALGQMCKYTGSKANNLDRTGAPLNDDDLNTVDDLTKPKPPPKTPSGCMAAGMGYVTSSSGATTCVSAGSGGEVKKNSESGTGESGSGGNTSTDSTKSESKGPGGTGTTVETKTTKNADGSTTTVTTTTTKSADGTIKKEEVTQTKNASGQVTDSKTKTETGNEDSFCKNNPASPLCKYKESKFSGECKKGFVCEGDAATCAIAQASWQTNCLFSNKDTGGLIPENAPAGTEAQLAAAEAALNRDGARDINIADSFNGYKQNWINYSSNCPVQDQTFQIGPNTLELPAGFVCDIGNFVRLLVHAMAYLSLLRLFSRGLV